LRFVRQLLKGEAFLYLMMERALWDAESMWKHLARLGYDEYLRRKVDGAIKWQLPREPFKRLAGRKGLEYALKTEFEANVLDEQNLFYVAESQEYPGHLDLNFTRKKAAGFDRKEFRYVIQVRVTRRPRRPGAKPDHIRTQTHPGE
jgi:hypothetical protein